MPIGSREDQADFYLRQFDKDFGETLKHKRGPLNLLAVARISKGSWRLNYDETLRVLITVTLETGGEAQPQSAPLRVNISVNFQMMIGAAWRPWIGSRGSGVLISTDSKSNAALPASRQIISGLAKESQRPEIIKAIRTASAYDRTHGQRP